VKLIGKYKKVIEIIRKCNTNIGNCITHIRLYTDLNEITQNMQYILRNCMNMIGNYMKSIRQVKDIVKTYNHINIETYMEFTRHVSDMT